MFSSSSNPSPITRLKAQTVKLQKNPLLLSDSEYFSEINSGVSLTRNPSEVSFNGRYKKNFNSEEKEKKKRFSIDSEFVDNAALQKKVSNILKAKNY